VNSSPFVDRHVDWDQLIHRRLFLFMGIENPGGRDL
jgi:hypothetical protein